MFGGTKLVVIETKKGDEHKFVMWGRDRFAEETKKRIKGKKK